MWHTAVLDVELVCFDGVTNVMRLVRKRHAERKKIKEETGWKC